jgi:hypothetical protein
MIGHVDRARADPDARNAALDRRLEDVGWGTVLIMVGAIWLIPDAQVPQALWLVATGLVLVALNVVRYLHALRVRFFGAVLGVVLVATGVGRLIGTELPLVAVGLIVIGAGIILRPLLERRT